MNKILSLLLIIAITTSSIFAETGIDIDSGTSASVSSSDWSCLAGQNQKVIIQIYSGGYGLNSHFAAAYQGAKSAGLQVDAYAFLCNQCHGNDPSGSIKEISSYFSQNGISIGNLWIDVEQCNGCWGSVTTNAQFVVSTVQNAKAAGLPVGIYTSVGEWPQTVGNLNSLSSFPLWYAHYDNNPSFSDFTSFGGWSSGVMKQYQGNTQQCGVSVDLDYFGSSSTSSSSTTSSGSGSGSTTSPITSGGSGTSSSGSSTTSGSGSSSSPISSGSTTSGSGSGSSTTGSGSGSSTTSGSGSSSSPITGSGSSTTSGSGSGSSTTGSGSGPTTGSGSGSSTTGSGSGSSTTSGSGSGSGSSTSSGSGSGSSTGSGSTSSGSGSSAGSGTTTGSGSGSGSGSGTSGSGTTSSSSQQ